MTYTITFKGKRFAPLSHEEEFALFEALRRGDADARDRLINANIKFAAGVARGYQGHGLSIEDLTMEAGLGLLRAVDRFDHHRGLKFISYAVWWIKQGILTALAEQGRVVNVPPNRIADLKKVDGARRRIEQGGDRAASLQEIADEIDFPLKKVEDTLAILGQAMSLDCRPEPDADVTLMDILIDPAADACGETEVGMDGRYLRKLFDSLEPLDVAILRRYFGIDRQAAETLQEIADDLGLTRERIRQRKEKALALLKRRARSLGAKERGEERPLPRPRRAVRLKQPTDTPEE